MCFKMFFRKLGGIHNSMNIYRKYLIRGLPVLHSSLRCSGESHPKIVVRWIHQAAKSKKIKDVGPMGFFLLLVPVTTFGLGTWQVQRRKWKIGLIKELEEITTALPIDLPQNLQELQNMEYQKVKVRGKFDHSQEIYITPRSLLKEGGEGDEGGLLSSGQSGTLVITPLMLTDRE
ncbi:surfeit locus protein 1-like [Limulus polyphemus]|uniref:SURF1-like protein n=1 Tax=Limulus polyphemus TaxID=6850 RepID=A0ABM1C0J4_LIMPO|nr:surfeit locus protein 1-like [Limulus polyphemus]